MNREETIKEIGRPLLMPLGIVYIVFLLVFISTPFIWMWFDWSLAWRVGLSGLFGAVVMGVIYQFVKNVIDKVVTDELDKIEDGKPTTSRFQEKLNKAMEASRQAKAN